MKPYGNRSFPRYDTDERRNDQPHNRRRDDAAAIEDSMTGAKDQCDLDAEATLCGLCLKEDCPICFGPETLGEE